MALSYVRSYACRMHAQLWRAEDHGDHGQHKYACPAQLEATAKTIKTRYRPI